MISSLFIGSPWSSVYDGIVFYWAQPASRLGHDRGLSKDQSPGTAPRGNGACENRALLIPRLKSVRERGRDIARPFAIYSNCKSIVSSIRGAHIGFFFATAKNAQRQRSADADAGSLEKLQAATIAVRLAPRCTNLVSDHRGGSLVVGDRRNRLRVRRGLARFWQALESELKHLVHPFHRKNFQSILVVVRDFCQILHVLVRDEDGLDAAPVRREELLLESTDHQDFAAQRDLAGQGKVRPDGNSG